MKDEKAAKKFWVRLFIHRLLFSVDNLDWHCWLPRCKGGRIQRLHGPNFHLPSPRGSTPPFSTARRPSDNVAHRWNGVLYSNSDWRPTGDENGLTSRSSANYPQPSATVRSAFSETGLFTHVAQISYCELFGTATYLA